MEFHFSIWCLFFSANFGFFVSCAENLEDDPNFKTDRWQREFKDFKTGLKIMNDEGQLIELTLENRPPEDAKINSRENIMFYLYTKQNPTKPQRFTKKNGKLEASYFNPMNPTIFITHGWFGGRENVACTIVRDAYLKNEDSNVIVVDWSPIAAASYLWSVSQVQNVGAKVAAMISYMQSCGALSFAQTTLVGHSLGAHVMGIAGYRLNRQIGNIIGLDPALPLFAYASPGERISSKDARHVQIVHTNCGLLGFVGALGHTDYYINGGVTQPGCINDILGICSHLRAIYIFAESINTNRGFWALECSSPTQRLLKSCIGPRVALLGGPKPRPKGHGTFYLPTNSKSPFALRNSDSSYLKKYHVWK